VLARTRRSQIPTRACKHAPYGETRKGLGLKRGENKEKPMASTEPRTAHSAKGEGNPFRQALDHGQSLWLDYIRRGMLDDGELQRLVSEGLRGLTSNPAIFEKAIAASHDYDEAWADIRQREDVDGPTVYEEFAVSDLQRAADLLRPVYDATRRRDGFVSLEVSPHLAHDTRATIAEARRLWDKVNRPNLMIKIPATPEGLAAIRETIGAGINVNVTLLFAREMYRRVIDAYMGGLEIFAARGGDLARVASVASFFVSRVDTAVDEAVEERLKAPHTPELEADLRSLQGQVAVANAKLAYEDFKEAFQGMHWKESLAPQGAQVQRLLWASTSTKNPHYRDVMYVEELIGPQTVNTLPPATLDAFRDHGRVRTSLEEHVDAARDVLATVERCGLSMEQITSRLLDDGVRLFVEAFDRLLAAVEQRLHAPATSGTR
jgi:transaldolase/glucose-6-phosphate isomerase